MGTGGKNLKGIQTRTHTQINIAKDNHNDIDETDKQDEDDKMVAVIITGDHEGCALASKEIDAIVSARVSFVSYRFLIIIFFFLYDLLFICLRRSFL